MAYLNYNTPTTQNGNDLLFSTTDFFDVINGFGGIDTVSYAFAVAAVDVDLSIRGFQNTGGSFFDRLINIENLIGTQLNDTLSGDGGNNELDGGAGTDTVSYRSATAGVVVDLSLGFQNTVGAGWDTLKNFENLTGSKYNDTLKGNAGNNVLNGGAGTDTVSYDNSLAGVTVSLALATPQNTIGAGIDSLIGFENLTGSKFNDKLTGSTENNSLSGLDGNDVLIGSIGYDRLDGGANSDTVDYSNLGGPVILRDFGAVDKAAFGDDKIGNIETVLASSGSGDTIDYSGSFLAGTTTNLSTTSTTTPSGLVFKIQLFENVFGTDLSDSIIGDSLNNILSGGGGNDKMDGLKGNDALDGGKGNDTLFGGFGNDFLDGGPDKDLLSDNSGKDIFNFSEAADTAVGSADVITGFATGSLATISDFIGLTMIDADTSTPEDDGFSNGLIASALPIYSNVAQLRWFASGGNVFLYGNTDSNFATDEFEIQINGIAAISLTNILI